MRDDRLTELLARTATAAPPAPVRENRAQGAELSWLVPGFLEEHRREFLSAREETGPAPPVMSAPVETADAYRLFGMCLGALPPAAIFFRIFGYGLPLLPAREASAGLFFLCLVMNVVCCWVGAIMGGFIGRRTYHLDEAPWVSIAALGVLFGFLWGAATGAAGGAVFFGFGALFGMICAVPVGGLAFGLFTPLHRLLARGGMIEAGHFWPLACGITMALVALILSPRVFPY